MVMEEEEEEEEEQLKRKKNQLKKTREDEDELREESVNNLIQSTVEYLIQHDKKELLELMNELSPYRSRIGRTRGCLLARENHRKRSNNDKD